MFNKLKKRPATQRDGTKDGDNLLAAAGARHARSARLLADLTMGWNTARKKEGTRYIAQPLSLALRLSLSQSQSLLSSSLSLDLSSRPHAFQPSASRIIFPLLPPTAFLLLLPFSLSLGRATRSSCWLGFSAACLLGQPELVKNGDKRFTLAGLIWEYLQHKSQQPGGFLILFLLSIFLFFVPHSPSLSLIPCSFLVAWSYRSDTSSRLFLSSFQVRI